MAGLNKNVYNVNKIKTSSNATEDFNYIAISKFDICSVLISVIISVADTIIDGVLIYKFLQWYDHYFAVIALFIHIILIVIIQILSIKWHLINNITSKIHWLTHCCLFGVIHRYISLGCCLSSDQPPQNCQEIYHQRHEVHKLHLLYTFLKSLPQLVLNFYIIISAHSWINISGLSLSLSLFSIIWTLLQYFRSAPIVDKKSLNKIKAKIYFHLAWNTCILTARVAVFVLLVICFKFWIFLLLGVHWFGSTVWIFKISKRSDLTFTTILYNCVIAFTHCFSLIDFDTDSQFIQIFTYYIAVILENVLSVSLSFVMKTDVIQSNLMFTLTFLAISGTVVGCSIVFLYHKYFYSSIKFKKKLAIDPESTREVPESESGNTNTRISVKKKKFINEPSTNPDKNSMEGTLIDGDTADRKLLLENLVARSGTPTFICTPILDESTSNDVLFHSVLNTTNETSDIFEDPKQKLNHEEPNNMKYKLKRRGICSPSDLGLQTVNCIENGDMFLDEIEQTVDLTANKRRGICSSIQLEQYDDVLSNATDDIRFTDDTRKKRRPIYVTFDNSDIEIVMNNDLENEKCEIESKHSDDSKYTLILSAPSEIMSAHDYENVCAVNIAREFWGLRSWRGYSDIETWLHDDSIVREQDNITSTVATSTSSEISSNDGFERAMSPAHKVDQTSRLTSKSLSALQDNASFVSKPTNGCRRLKTSDDRDVFIAKPYIIDQNGSLLPLSTLSPIKEELEECADKVESGSTLVTTIDVIRKNTVANSPRYVYHRTEHLLESPTSMKSVYKPKSLWNSGYADNAKTVPVNTKPIYENHTISKNRLIANSKILLKLCDNELESCDNLTNIMYLDKPVISTSLQSLVSSSSSEDILSIAEIARCFPLVKKPAGRPRRKFSLIRDRFEMTVRKQSSNFSENFRAKSMLENSYLSDENKENYGDPLEYFKSMQKMCDNN